ncbi:MAG: hypothetical protein PVI33_02295 [Candidatus Omnitrophota bacterium]|jgi:hypothetical protein
MAKVRYEIDPHNRLVIKKTGQKGELKRFRQVLDGRFKLDRNNNLFYHIKAPVDQDPKAPHQIKLRGKWSLTQNHDLRFTLDKWRRQTFGDKLTLQGDIIDVKRNSLLFALATRSKQGTQSLYSLKLEGSWQADQKNRIFFRLKRGKDKYDILTLDGIWQLDKNYQLIYKYEKVRLKTRKKRIHTLGFKGFWDIKNKSRISYVIDKNSNSVFNFQTKLGVFKDRYIKYELGIGLKHQPIRRTIKLFGRWRIKQGVGLVFEVRYNNRTVQALVFGAEARLTPKNTVLFKLRNERNRRIGAQFKLSHKILKGDGEAFLRLLKSRQDSAILVGAGWGW